MRPREIGEIRGGVVQINRDAPHPYAGCFLVITRLLESGLLEGYVPVPPGSSGAKRKLLITECAFEEIEYLGPVPFTEQGST